MSEQEIIAAFLKQHRPEFLAAGEAFLKQNIEWILIRAAGSLTQQSMWAAVDRLDEENKLVLAAEFQSAWDQFVYLNPEKDGFAFRRVFLEAMRKKEMQAAHDQEYRSLVKELGPGHHGLRIEDLKALSAARNDNARRKALSLDELRTLARQERPVVAVAGALPQFYKGIELTAENLKAAGTRNAVLSLSDFRAMCERFSVAAVNERMGVPSAQKKQYEPLPDNITREDVIRALRGEAARIWTRRYGHDALNKRIFQQ